MTTEELVKRLQDKFPEIQLSPDETPIEPALVVPPEGIAKVCEFLRNDPQLRFDSLMCLSGLEAPEEFQTVYHLYSNKHRHKIKLRCKLPKDNPEVPSVSLIWRTADWHEREAYDLLGIRFLNHPDHRRILCPDDWEGHPLRKDYVPQERWHDIPLTNLVPEGRTES